MTHQRDVAKDAGEAHLGGVDISHLLDLVKPTRRNNDHWTSDEVRKLVKGVLELGVGRWTRVMSDYFPSTSIRTPTNLKDKWKNLVKACKGQVKPHKATARAIKGLKDQILKIDRESAVDT
ncbi:hypothetical protein ACP70R_009274 [Stipagrostis hirtigluma subsp. patula]